MGRPSHPEPLIESLWVFFLTHETESARKLSEGGESKKEKKNAERDAARPLPASHSSHATRRTIVNRSVHATWPAEVGSFTARSSHTRSPVQRRRTGMGLYPHLRMLPIGKKKQKEKQRLVNEPPPENERPALLSPSATDHSLGLSVSSSKEPQSWWNGADTQSEHRAQHT